MTPPRPKAKHHRVDLAKLASALRGFQPDVDALFADASPEQRAAGIRAIERVSGQLGDERDREGIAHQLDVIAAAASGDADAWRELLDADAVDADTGHLGEGEDHEHHEHGGESGPDGGA
jgi:hypothetical protein